MTCQSPESRNSDKKINLLILMADQMQARILEPDSPCVTPNLDKLLARGVRFENAYTSNPVCSPARAGIMTGLLPHNHGVLTVTHCADKDQSCLRTEHPHWAQRLQADGYDTAYFGKWHVENTESPSDFGWNKDFSRHSDPFKKRVVANKNSPEDITGKKIIIPGYKETFFYGVTDTPAEKRAMGVGTALTLEYLDEACDKPDDPWCCFVSFSEPHDPFICSSDARKLYNSEAFELPDNFDPEHQAHMPGLYRKSAAIFKGLTEQEKREAMACYYASITEIDRLFGKILDMVEAKGQMEDTLVVVMSDHGELLGAHGLYCKNFSAFEEVYNIPFVFAGPAIKEDVVSDARIGSHDFCPTILEYMGLEAIESPDSKSFAELLSNPDATDNFQDGYAESFGSRIYLTQRVIWNGPWKYIFNGFDYDELYNLEDDPFELNNLAADSQYEDKLHEMAKLMWQKIKATGDRALLNMHYAPLRLVPCGPHVVNE